MNTPTISIVIPTYNGERYLSESLDSVRYQTFRNWEAVVIDDGSVDGTVAVAEEYAGRDTRIRVVQQQNGGVARARNGGLSETSPNSTYVIFLDHDDFWEPNALSNLIDAVNSVPDCVCASGIARFVNEIGMSIKEGELEESGRDRLELKSGRVKKLTNDDPSTFGSFAIRNYMVTPGLVLMKREILVKVGAFDQDVAPCDDWDMYARLSRHGCFVFLNKVILNYRLHFNNASLNSEKMRTSEQLFRRKLATSKENTEEQAVIAKAAYKEWQKYLIRRKVDFAFDALKRKDFVSAVQQISYMLKPLTQLLKNI